MSRSLCLFTDSLYPSGVGEHMLTLGAALRQQYRVALVCPPSPPGQLLLQRARALGLETLALTVRGDPVARQCLCAWLQARRGAIFHGHAGSNREGYDGIYAAHEAGAAAIVRTEHLPEELADPAERRAYQRLQQAVDRIICVSAGVAATFWRAGVAEQRLRVVHNGINPPAAEPDRAGVRAALGVPPDALVALTVARFYPQKGHRYLAEAIPAVLAREHRAHFVWVGEGAEEGALRQQLAALGVDRHVTFVGQRPDVPSLLTAADVFVLPSLYEGLPLVALEAMAVGTPVVGTNVCGTNEVIDDGVTGRLVKVRDAAALAGALLEALLQPDRRVQWGDAGRRRFAERFTAARMARETVGVYEEVLHEKAARSHGLAGPDVTPVATASLAGQQRPGDALPAQ
jgi:glycosyltransferase involved in cell wall biosynthesis